MASSGESRTQDCFDSFPIVHSDGKGTKASALRYGMFSLLLWSLGGISPSQQRLENCSKKFCLLGRVVPVR